MIPCSCENLRPASLPAAPSLPTAPSGVPTARSSSSFLVTMRSSPPFFPSAAKSWNCYFSSLVHFSPFLKSLLCCWPYLSEIYCPTHSLLKADKNVLLKHTSRSFQNFTTSRWLFINIVERQLHGLMFLDFRNCGILVYTVTHIAIQPEHLSSHPRPVENWMRLKISSLLSTEYPSSLFSKLCKFTLFG